MIFDLCAFLFYFCGLTAYISWRSAGRALNVIESLAMVGFCLAAAESKEIAATFPIALVLTELTVLDGRLRPAKKWIPFLLCAVIVCGVLGSRLIGPSALAAMNPYKLHLSAGHYLDNYANYLGQLFFKPEAFFRPYILLMIALPPLLGALYRSRTMLWAAMFNLFSILPIAFIYPRNLFAFFVPLVGWAVFVATAIACIRGRIILRWPGTGPLSQVVVCGLICLLVLRPEFENMYYVRGPAVDGFGLLNKPYYEDLRRILPPGLKNKRVLALRHPFKLSWAFYFLLELGWRDETIFADTADVLKERGSPVVPADYDYVVDFDKGHFKLAGKKL